MGTISDTTKTAKNLAQQVAKQVAQEPLEILKNAGQQTGMTETSLDQSQSINQEGQTPARNASQSDAGAEKAKIEARGVSQLQALEAELRDIRAQKEQKKMAAVEQERVVKTQEAQTPQQPLVEPLSKQGRKMIGMPGRKAQVQKQQTHVERIQPPSG